MAAKIFIFSDTCHKLMSYRNAMATITEMKCGEDYLQYVLNNIPKLEIPEIDRKYVKFRPK